MGKRGPKKRPTKLTLLKGNPGKRSLPKNEPQPPKASLSPPGNLNDRAIEEWKRVAPELAAVGLLTSIDRVALAQYCLAYSRWYEAEEQLRQFGLLVKTKSGFPVQSPWLPIANRAFDQLRRMLSEFGMTPSSRAGIDLEPLTSSEADAMIAEVFPAEE